MLVMYGNNNVLVLAITDDQIEDMRAGRTLTFEGTQQLVRDIIVMYGRDRAHVMEQLRAAGVDVSSHEQGYLAGQRTDRPRKAH